MVKKKIYLIDEGKMDLTKFIRKFSRFYFGDKSIKILEAGAERGDDTEYFCKAFPNGQIYAFEPDPRRHERLKMLSSFYSNLHYENCALGIENKEIDFYLSTRVDNNHTETWGSSSVLKPKKHLEIHPQIKFDLQPIKIKSTNLDFWMQKKSITSFDMMWLDMQGYEYDVLNSSPNSTNGCDFIYSEVQLIESYEGNKLYDNLKNLLDIRGFEPVIEELPWKDAGNVLFFKKELAEKAKLKIKELISLEQ